MPTPHELFWTRSSFAFVGDSGRKPFPQLSYGEARKQGKKVFAIDPTAKEILGDRTYLDFAALPQPVEGAVLEVPREDTQRWVGLAADAGIKSVWIHMNRETPEALALAKDRGVEVLTGTCAVMYLKQGLSYHSVHKWISKATGKY